MTVLVFGTFDLLHPGHLHFFKQARSMGDSLTVVVGTDKNVTRIKGTPPQETQAVRVDHIEKTHLATKVLLAPEDYNYISLLQQEKPTIIALGYDQHPPIRQLKKELRENGLTIKVIRLKPHKPHRYKSSLFKRQSKQQS